MREIELPPLPALEAAAQALEAALVLESPRAVKAAGEVLLELLARTYGVSVPSLAVLGTRPKQSYEGGGSWELFGDYTFETERIRVWMRTAVRGKVTSYRGLLNTLLHEFCHHLDIHRLGFSETPHTRGFYHRVDALYHAALATPPPRRKPLLWIRTGRAWRTDWSRLRQPPP